MSADIQSVLEGRERWCVVQGDCLDVMRGLPDGCVDAVVTDPPYGIPNWNASARARPLSQQEVEDIQRWDVVVPPEQIKEIVALAPVSVVWGGNYLLDGLGRCRAPLVWNKLVRGMHLADGEMAWTNFTHGTLRILDYSPGLSEARSNRQHPTQKPVEVMRWSISLAKIPANSLILDPYCGSGTTGVAAVQLGHRFIGIEREASYCAIARRRIADAAAQGNLFTEAL
jgi:DNA modification methylase